MRKNKEDNNMITQDRAVHGSVRVGFVPNPQPTRSDRVEKFQTRHWPRKATDRVGSGGRWAVVGFDFDRNTKIKHKFDSWRTKSTDLQPKEKIYKLKEHIHKSKEQKAKEQIHKSTNPQIKEPKRWNRKIESERWRQRWARTLRTKSEGRRRRAQIDDGEAEIDDGKVELMTSRIDKG